MPLILSSDSDSVLFRVRVCLFPPFESTPLSPDRQSILGPDFVARKVPLYRRFREHACGPSDPGVGGGGGGGGPGLVGFLGLSISDDND